MDGEYCQGRHHSFFVHGLSQILKEVICDFPVGGGVANPQSPHL